MFGSMILTVTATTNTSSVHSSAEISSAGNQTFAYVVGARPNYVKMASVIAAMRERAPGARHLLINTGQHYDPVLSTLFLEVLGMQSPDYELEVGSASHAVQTARVMERIEPILVDEKVDVVIVPGDVNSTLAAALVASKLGISIVHLEAGLRSGDRTMPEELNRILVDQLSDLLLTHSPEAQSNLEAEGINPDKVRMVGNTMIDALVAVRDRFDGLDPAAEFGLSSGEYLLVTLHRPALVDGPLLLDAMAALAEVSESIPVLFPVHPRTRSRLNDYVPPAALHLCEPLGYLDFLAAQSKARAVLTDSGGVQEETTFLGVPCFTLRNNTERPVTVDQGSNALLGLDTEAIRTIPARLEAETSEVGVPDLWDGESADRVVDALIEAGLVKSLVQSIA